jgi:hypothetical protein
MTLTNDSFYVALEERERMAIAKPRHDSASKGRERLIAAFSFAALGALVIGFAALRLWLLLPHWVHFAD